MRTGVALVFALLVAQGARADPGPDLGTIRYRDPPSRRMLWLGLDLGGVYLPRGVALGDRRVWTLHAIPAWALALTPWLAAGGRHGLVWYDAENVRLRLHGHELELAGRVFGGRLALGAEFHALESAQVARADGKGHIEFAIGGVDDVVARLDYGRETPLGERWRVGWNVQARHAWVFTTTQRQVRGSARLTWLLSPDGYVSAEAVGFVVHRDATQFGRSFDRLSAHAQIALELGQALGEGFSLVLRARAANTFMSGEAPLYETREESLTTPYGELVAGVRAVWD